jgi:hypothetical protein
MLGISHIQMYWRNWKLTLKTLLMEVFTASTPTSSGNYKAILETLPVEYECDTPEGFFIRGAEYEVIGRPEHLG